MFRSILGFAILAVVAWLALKLILGLLGVAFGFAVTLLWLAGIGFVFYLALRMISPRTADRLRDMIKGRPADAS
jgi:threonine/homoserine/homoserine lactone efflux protein